MRLLILLISTTLSQAVVSADWKKMEGIYAVTGKGYIDPMEN